MKAGLKRPKLLLDLLLQLRDALLLGAKGLDLGNHRGRIGSCFGCGNGRGSCAGEQRGDQPCQRPAGTIPRCPSIRMQHRDLPVNTAFMTCGPIVCT